jgi:hypothetical protein
MRVIEKADIAPIEPLLCSIQAGTAIIGRSERFIIDAIARGTLKAVKSDRRTLLLVQSLRDYVASLPPAKGTKNPSPLLRESPAPWAGNNGLQVFSLHCKRKARPPNKKRPESAGDRASPGAR